MPMDPLPAVTLTPVAHFPEGYFLENLAVRADGSVLITTVLQKELWYVPAPEPPAVAPGAEASPVPVHTFDYPVMGITEAEPDVFIVCVTDGYASHESYLARIDLNGWSPGKPVTPERIFTFDGRVRALSSSAVEDREDLGVHGKSHRHTRAGLPIAVRMVGPAVLSGAAHGFQPTSPSATHGGSSAGEILGS